MKKNLNITQIELIIKSLDFGMNFKQGQLRNKILKVIEPANNQYHTERISICEKYAIKDDKGEFVLKTNDKGQPEFTFLEESQKVFQEELGALRHKFLEVDFTKDNLVSELRNFIHISSVAMSNIDVILLEELLDLLKQKDEEIKDDVKQD